jgi:hypothetical protein
MGCKIRATLRASKIGKLGIFAESEVPRSGWD